LQDSKSDEPEIVDMSGFKGKHILLGVTASVAVYKACELARMFIRSGAKVRVVMSKNSTELVGPLLFETLTGNCVYVDMFPKERLDPMKHIGLADWADIFVVAPATANFIGKAAGGIADDLISTTYLTLEVPVVIAPAMNTRMWNDPSVRANVETLKERGVVFVGPGSGKLACGTSGAGRLTELEEIFGAVEEILRKPGPLSGITMLVTAGPTREYIDDVRFLSNPSTGKMGFAIAEEASAMGADVILIHGATSISLPDGVEEVAVISAEEMKRAVFERAEEADVFVMSAAVADWTVEKREGKIKKAGRDKLVLELVPTSDILAEIGAKYSDRVLVGFAVETENILENAKGKMARKNLDIIFANDPNREGSAFAGDTNAGLLISKRGITEVPLVSKSDVARMIISEVCWSLKEKRIDT
jgi:phosphopantothenoylcysteine decarboxylase/phosphopantothenate--cysteine ligase